MKVILLIIPILSLIFAAVNGKMSELSSSIISKSGEAVELVISLCGVMCFWCGLMKVAERAGLTEKLAKLISPVVCALFRGLPRGSRAVGLITMNLAANILGLGNASTPLGIAAMRELADIGQADGNATDNMILLTVLNTASLQIIPATAAALRSANGAENPFDILPCVWIVSVYAAVVAVLAAKIMGHFARRRKK
ncbi:MAG: spore maturation protein A [Oscillospiraceae bacterium]|nr:spore maturation protein A [Oscillospiraceae bacterium]